MTFDDYLDLLDRLVADGILTFAEAEILAASFDEFDEIDDVIKPEDMPGWTDTLDPIVMAILAATLFSILRRNVSRNSTAQTMTVLSYQQRTTLFGTIQDSYQQESASLARDLANGVLSPEQWQEAMNTSILSHFRSAAYAAYGTVNLTPAQEASFQQAVRVQQAYLTRFADQYVLAQVRGTPWSEAYIANRAAMYSGAMRAFAFRGAESSAGFEDGWVHYYIAVDDENTCDPCIQAMQQGPYLPGAGPYPGEVCEGRHRCRCNRYPVYDPDAYAILIR